MQQPVASHLNCCHSCFNLRVSLVQVKNITEFSVRGAPYPYISMVAFDSDVDETTFQSFYDAFSIFCGLDEETSDLSLEVSSSFFLQFESSIRKNDIHIMDRGGKLTSSGSILKEFIPTSLFHGLHTYGSYECELFNRNDALRCIDAVERFELDVVSWSYHGDKRQKQNIWSKSGFWVGDVPCCKAYHADLLTQSGIRYFRFPPSLNVDGEVSGFSQVELRDGQKVLGYSGHSLVLDYTQNEYDRHLIDCLVDGKQLPRSFPTERFIQPSTNFPFKIQTWLPELLGLQLSPQRVQALSTSPKNTIFIQHLSKSFCVSNLKNPIVLEGLRRLQRAQDDKKILCTSLKRYLSFMEIQQALKESLQIYEENQSVVVIFPVFTLAGRRISICHLEGQSVEIISVNMVKKIKKNGLSVRLASECIAPTNYQLAFQQGKVCIYFEWAFKVSENRALLREWKKILNPISSLGDKTDSPVRVL